MSEKRLCGLVAQDSRGTVDMSVTLIATVGTGRTRTDIAGAIAFSVREHQAARAVFCCSEKTAAEVLPEIARQLGWPESRYTLHTSTQHEDVDALYAEYIEVIDQAAADGTELVVDFTSGTKAMSAAMFAAAVARQVAQVSYITGPRDDGGRVTRSEWVISFRPALVLAERQLAQAVDQFNRGQFAAAAMIGERLQDTLPEGTLHSLATCCAMLGEGYALWDQFAWTKAFKRLSPCTADRHDWPWVDRDQVRRNRQLCHDAKANDYTVARMVDLLANARRRFDQKRFDDAVARCYRGFEYLAQCRLKTAYDQRTKAIDLNKLAALPGEARRKWQNHFDRKAAPKIGLTESYELLADLGDALGATFRRDYGGRKKDAGDLQNWLNQRNDSWLAHGTVPVKAETARNLLDRLRCYVKRFMPEATDRLRDAEMVKIHWPPAPSSPNPR